METINYIKEAVSASITLMPMHTFINRTHFPVAIFRLGVFYNTMIDNYPIYIDDLFIQWLGYTGPTPYDRFTAFTRDLYKHIINVDFYCLTIEEYTAFLQNTSTTHLMYYPHYSPHLPVITPVNTPKYHILLTPECFKSVIEASTEARVYKHYHDLIEVFKTYAVYKQTHAARVPVYDDISEWDYIDINSAPDDTDVSNERDNGTIDTLTKKLLDDLPSQLSGSRAAQMFAAQYLDLVRPKAADA